MQHSSYKHIIELHPLELIAQSVPQRSCLYPLEPMGIGSPDVECLTGYAARLADRHHVTTGDLMKKEVRPALGKPTVYSNVALYAGGYKAINGIGITASDLVSALEHLTLRQELKYTTMLPWKGLLSRRLLIRPRRAWCPVCYEESAAVGKVYDQLIWTVSAVNVCAKHNRRLEHCCPHCGREQAHIAFNSRPGYCHRCKRWLNDEGKFRPPSERNLLPPTEKEVWIAEQVGELLATTPDLLILSTRASFAKGLAKCIEESKHGKLSAFVFDLPVTEHTIRVWLGQTQAPILGSLLEICFRLNKRLLDLMSPSVDLDESNCDVALMNDRHTSRYLEDAKSIKVRLDWAVVENELRKAVTECPPPSLSKLAGKVRRDRQALKRRFPELTASIIERSRNYYNPPLDNELAERILIAACSENPPPSLSDIAKRLGRTGGTATLYSKFPELCRKIVNRWRSERKRVLNYEKIEKQLRAILEEPPPHRHF